MSVLDVWTEQNRRLAIKLDVLALMVDVLIAVHQLAVSNSTENQ
ncbi:hypothetical protein [uncultured Microbacterium sp.]|nr:hypothetical protein [uncultured Microbacterium sp.]